MLGIGLGGFAQGFEKGVGIAEKMDKMDRQRALDTAVDQGQAEHNTAVEAGTAQAGDANSILRFTMPKIMGPLIKQGDLKGAESASEWLRSDETKRATESFGRGMVAAQAGDMGTALTHFVQAGRVKGYGPDMTIDNPQPIEGGGFRVNLKTKDGRAISKDFRTPDEVIQFGATNLNPVKAYELWQAERTADTTANRDVSTDLRKYGGRKPIDREDTTTRITTGIDPQTQQVRGQRMLNDVQIDYDKTRQAVGLDPESRELRTYQGRKDIDRQYRDSDTTDATETEKTRYENRKAVDLEHEQAQRAAGLGPANYSIVHRQEQDESGKPVTRSYKMDARSGALTPIEGVGAFNKAGGTGGAGGGKRFNFEVVRDAYIDLGYSKEDAVKIASGQKPPKDTDLVNVARQLTNMEMPPTDMRFKPEQRRGRYEEVLKELRTRNNPNTAPSGLPRQESVTGVETKDAPAMSGDGSTGKPFQATSQDHVNWFRKNAKPGAVIVIDGKSYTK